MDGKEITKYNLFIGIMKRGPKIVSESTTSVSFVL
jgi:hypothetical protein